jgi:hypothetical protein
MDLGIEVVEDRHLVATMHEEVHEVRPDEASPTSDQNPHDWILPPSLTPERL